MVKSKYIRKFHSVCDDEQFLSITWNKIWVFVDMTKDFILKLLVRMYTTLMYGNEFNSQHRLNVLGTSIGQNKKKSVKYSNKNVQNWQG